MTKDYIDESDLASVESTESKIARLDREIHDTRVAILRSGLDRINKEQKAAQKKRKEREEYLNPPKPVRTEFDNAQFPSYTAGDFD